MGVRDSTSRASASVPHSATVSKSRFRYQEPPQALPEQDVIVKQ